MLTGLAHTAVCVPDVDTAVRWYEAVLGLTVIWPPTLMEGADIQRDRGELVASPVALRAAILGVRDSGDRVLEANDVEFLTSGIARIAGLRTTWFRDPWRNVFILIEKHEPAKPYYQQF